MSADRHYGIPARADNDAPASWKTWAMEFALAAAGIALLLLGYGCDWRVW